MSVVSIPYQFINFKLINKIFVDNVGITLKYNANCKNGFSESCKLLIVSGRVEIIPTIV